MAYIPPEVLLHIFSFLKPNFERQGYCDLASLPQRAREIAQSNLRHEIEEESARQLALSRVSRASKQFRRVALPLLYHTIPVTSDKLLELLSQNAEIAKLVKAIDLGPTGLTPKVLEDALRAAHPIDDSPPFKDASYYRLFNSVYTAITGPGRYKNCGAAEVVVHLMLLPNLEALKFHCVPETDTLLTAFFEWHHRGATCLPKLRELRPYYYNGYTQTAFINIAQQLMLPTIEKLHGCGISWISDADAPMFHMPPLTVRLPELRELYLFDGNFLASGVSNMLSRCPQLQVLRVRWPEPPNPFVVDFSLLGRSLRRYGQGLKVLELKPYGTRTYLTGHSVGRLGSLRTLTQLRTLEAPQDVLVGSEFREDTADPRITLDEVLPDSLEKLNLFTVQGSTVDLDAEIRALIDGERLTKLHKIQLKRFTLFATYTAMVGWTLKYEEATAVLTKEGGNSGH